MNQKVLTRFVFVFLLIQSVFGWAQQTRDYAHDFSSDYRIESRFGLGIMSPSGTSDYQTNPSPQILISLGLVTPSKFMYGFKLTLAPLVGADSLKVRKDDQYISEYPEVMSSFGLFFGFTTSHTSGWSTGMQFGAGGIVMDTHVDRGEEENTDEELRLFYVDVDWEVKKYLKGGDALGFVLGVRTTPRNWITEPIKGKYYEKWITATLFYEL